jgi:branched-chain amino acid transport system substrate-binding protein
MEVEMKKFLLVALVVVLLAGLILGGCPKPAPTKVLKIGTILAMNTTQGIETKKWHDLLVKSYNDKGGWKIGDERYEVEMVTYDSQGDAVKAKDYLEKLVLQDGCKLLLGGSGTVSVDITITEPNKVLVIGGDLTNASADPKVQYYYTSGQIFTNAVLYRICKDMANKGVKNYVSVKPDTQFGHFIDAVATSTWKLADPNIKSLGTVYFDPSTVDYGPIAAKAISLNPEVIDLLYVGMVHNAVLQMYRALKDGGYKGVVLPGIADEGQVAELVTTCGKEFIEGGEVFSQDPRGVQKDPRMLSFIDEYTKEYGAFKTDGVGFVVGWFILEDAINATQSVDVDVLKAYLDNSKGSIRHVCGFAKLFARPDVDNYRTICGGWSSPVCAIQDGKLVPVAVVTMKDQYLFTVLSFHWEDTYKKYWEEYGYPTFPAEEQGENLLNYSDLGISGHD